MKPLAAAFLLACLPCTASNVCANDEANETRDVVTAVKKALPYLAERGNWWARTKKCASCHRTSFQVWAHAEASAKGFDVDQDKLKEWATWNLDSMQATNDDGKITGKSNLDGAAQMLVALEKVPDFEGKSKGISAILGWLRDGQQKDGSWKPAGQMPMQKRDKSETKAVTTMWNSILAGRAGIDVSVIAAATKFASKDINAKSTEWLVTRSLTAFNSSADQRAVSAALLLSEQNDDGGWGWIRGQTSDALATGQVLYALQHISSTQHVTDATKRAKKYLVMSQEEDGSWPTNGTKENRKDKVTETATYWGSAWATIGLLETLPNTLPNTLPKQ